MKNLSNTYSKTIIGLFYIILFSGCFTQEELDVEFDTNPPIVIHAVITDQAGPYYVHISRAVGEVTVNPVNFLPSANYIPITDATVTLSDDQGNSDVLVPYDQEFPSTVPQSETRTFAQYGFYRTSTNIQGAAGRAYTLTVQHEGKTYEAKATMPSTPPAITLNHEKFIYPLLSFNQPVLEENYYMFLYRDFFGDDPSNGLNIQNQFEDNLWPLFFPIFQVYTDQFWTEQVKDLDIYAPNYEQGQPIVFCVDCPENIQIQMHSISREAYEFYDALNQQTRNDGGTFNPEPAPPPTNFTNGALGLFRASSVRSITAPVRY